MPPASPQARFLLRGSLLLVALLTLWQLVLRQPLLYLLRGPTELCLRLWPGESSDQPLSVAASGDWNFQIPVSGSAAKVPGAAGASGPMAIRSIEFSIAYQELYPFTFSVPVFWAVLLAAPGGYRNIRALIWGTLLILLVETVSLSVFAEITARHTAEQWYPAAPLTAWGLAVGNYLVRSVIPYTAPFLIALVLLADLRGQILGDFASRRPDRKQLATQK
jgi:hypothetical protein